GLVAGLDPVVGDLVGDEQRGEQRGERRGDGRGGVSHDGVLRSVDGGRAGTRREVRAWRYGASRRCLVSRRGRTGQRVQVCTTVVSATTAACTPTGPRAVDRAEYRDANARVMIFRWSNARARSARASTGQIGRASCRERVERAA